MYEEFYSLTEKPFSIQPDPEFLFLSERHALAYAMLEYGVTNRAAFSVLTGGIGCGKTTLVRHLLTRLDPMVRVGTVNNTHPDIANLIEWIMLAFEQPYSGLSQVQLYDAFQSFLIEEHRNGRRVLLVVDEAQNLSPGALESLRMLSNINVDKEQILQVMLVGQPQLHELLNRPDLEQFKQRVSVQFFIPPLSMVDVERYIRHRLRVAGRTKPLFTLKACERIADASGGTPRVINILCDTALVYGYSSESKWIDDEMVEEVLNDRQEYGGIPG